MASAYTPNLIAAGPDSAATVRRGLVLSGGGALAAYEVGVMKALLTGKSAGTAKKSVNIDVISGTSAGGLNAGLFLSAAAPAADAIKYVERVWLEDIGDAPGKCSGGAFRFRCNPSSFFNPACYSSNPFGPLVGFLNDSAFIADDLVRRGINFWVSREDIEQRTLELVNFSTLVSEDGFRGLLTNKLRLDKIRSSPIALRIATTNWKTGQLRVFSNGDMTDQNGASIILASAAIPGVFASVEISNEPYVDGGVVLNTPLKPAIDAGVGELHAIYMDPEIAHLPLPRLENTASALYRALVTSFSATLKRDIGTARAINRGVALSLRAARGSHGGTPDISSSEAQLATLEMMRQKAGQPHRELTIHIYHPYKALGAGWFTFARDRLQDLIDHGFQDGVEHDCIRNRCVFPE